MKRALITASALALALALAGCGFQLRGTTELPFETLYIPAAHAGIALDLKRNVQLGTRTRVVEDAGAAQAVLQFTQETRERHILSLTGSGRVREFQLRYRVGFRVHDGKGGEFLPANTIELVRDMTYNDALVLAKQEEELLLYRDMQYDVVQQILRRLAFAQRLKPQPK